jgi:hypothetical protein
MGCCSEEALTKLQETYGREGEAEEGGGEEEEEKVEEKEEEI